MLPEETNMSGKPANTNEPSTKTWSNTMGTQPVAENVAQGASQIKEPFGTGAISTINPAGINKPGTFNVTTGQVNTQEPNILKDEQGHIKLPTNAIRTFQADVANLIKEKPISVAKIAIAEQTRRESLPEISINSPASLSKDGFNPIKDKGGSDQMGQNPTQGSTTSAITKPSKFFGGSVPEPKSLDGKSRGMSKLLLFILTIILLGGGAYAIYFSYNNTPSVKSFIDSLPIKSLISIFSKKTDSNIVNNVGTEPDTTGKTTGTETSPKATEPAQVVVPVPTPVQTPVSGSKIVSVNLESNKGIKDIALSTYKIATGSKNAIVSVIFNKMDTKNANSFVPINTEELFQLMASTPPRVLIKSLQSNYSFGYVNDDKQPYLILYSNNFANSYAGMLEWEKFIYDDVSALFSLPQSISTTQSELFKTDYVFKDSLVVSRDAREIQFPENRHLIYAFADNGTIIITTGIEPLRTLLQKLDAEVYIRQK